MATRNEKCKWCKAKFLVSIAAQVISCPRCSGTMYSSPIMNGNNAYALYNNNNQYYTPSKAKKKSAALDALQQMFIGPQLLSLPPAFGQKRAVLCGVSYKDHPKRLDGSINDVLCMKYFLVQRLGFPHASVIVLTEDEQDPYRTPTKLNIQRALSWLVYGCQAGDSLVFHYSGHGSKVRDQNWDEIDGHDEALCPVDFQTQGKILDDELNATIVTPLPHGVTLHAVIDTCFSGTFLDLPYMCRVNRDGYYLWEDHRIPYATTYKGTRGGLAICISACDDHQNSGDTTAFTGTATGALTYSLIETLEKEGKLTYGQLLMALRNKIHGVQKALGQNGPSTSQSSQEPQMSASMTFDIYSKQFNF